MKGQQSVGREEGPSWLMAQPCSSAPVTERLTTQPCSVRARSHIRQPLAGICVPQPSEVVQTRGTLLGLHEHRGGMKEEPALVLWVLCPITGEH